MPFIQRFEFGYHLNCSGKDAKKSDSGKSAKRYQAATRQRCERSDSKQREGLGSGLCSLTDV
jgi:hypothetical protein